MMVLGSEETATRESNTCVTDSSAWQSHEKGEHSRGTS